LSTTGPIVNVPTPETGTMGGASQHRSVTFNNPNAVKERLEKQMKEIQEKKDEAEKAVKEAEAAANSKKATADAKPVPIAA
jgi:predicted nucleotide-binding protein (sugar kinase/HSP70/actin superfamily)